MTTAPVSERQALSRAFASVVEAYDRGRPSYPPEAVGWLVGSSPRRVLELGAGTGRLTGLLTAAGHEVVATDPLPPMVGRLREAVPAAQVAVASAEEIPLPSRSVDVVVCAQAFHWFDHPRALPEIARVLRPGGRLALVWNARDRRIPWVRKLGALLDAHRPDGPPDAGDPAGPAATSEHFGLLEEAEFRFWQTLRRTELADLVSSRSHVALLSEQERAALLDEVAALYDDYGRGPDGLQLPYLTRCFRADVRHPAPAPPPPPAALSPGRSTAAAAAPGPEDPGTLLIDFR